MKKLIHFSSIGADSKSPSLDLRTKFVGEQEVLKEFPDAVILRLAPVVGFNDYLLRIFYTQY